MDALRKKSLLLPSKRSASDTGHSRHPKDPETPAQQAGQRIQTAQGKGWCSCVRPSCRYPWQLVAPSLLAHLFGLLGLARDGANFVQQLRAPGEVWRGKRTARAVVVYVRASAPNTERGGGTLTHPWTPTVLRPASGATWKRTRTWIRSMPSPRETGNTSGRHNFESSCSCLQPTPRPLRSSKTHRRCFVADTVRKGS